MRLVAPVQRYELGRECSTCPDRPAQRDPHLRLALPLNDLDRTLGSLRLLGRYDLVEELVEEIPFPSTRKSPLKERHGQPWMPAMTGRELSARRGAHVLKVTAAGAGEGVDVVVEVDSSDEG